MGRGMRRYLLLGIILLVLLGTFLGFGLVAGRRIMLDLIKEQARSFLSIIASTQEKMIFAEARLEDELIDEMLSVCSALEADLTRSNTANIRQSFGFHSITVFNKKTGQAILTSGTPFLVSSEIFEQKEPISFIYFDVANETFMRFVYVIAERIYQIELSAEMIKEFRAEFGINKIMSQMSANPMVNYLVLQDTEGILFATPNIETISRIEDDPELVNVVENKIETSRIEKFNDENVLELVRPFIIEGEMIGIFRIGISLGSYYRHVRRTEGQLIALFVIIFGASFLLILWLMNYQSYANIKELFDKTLGAIEDGVLLVDQKGKITAVNEMFCTMSTFDEDFLVRNIYDRVLPDDPFDIVRVMKEGKKIADEKQVFGRDLRYAAYPLFDERQRISGASAILHDVTTIREFEREREEAERLVFLGNLVANLAHEIKNPLNGLSIGIQRLTTEFSNEDADYVRITRSLKHEIDVLTKTVNDFLMLARPKMREKISFRLGGILNDLAPLLENSMKDKKIELNKTIGADIDLVGSAHDFRRALLNIIVNAIDAVSMVKDRKPKIDISLEESRGETKLTIADNGIGMDDEERKRIFSPYYSTKKSGTGLGLYIAQKIIKDHGGSIVIKSDRKTGTSFEITFRS